MKLNLNPMFSTNNVSKTGTRMQTPPLIVDQNHKSTSVTIKIQQQIVTLKPHTETVKPQVKSDDEKKTRKVRSDKTHDIKFPVTEEMRASLRRLSKTRDLSPTKNNTLLLRKALQIPTHHIREVEYKDTGTYMHAKPNQIDYGVISDLAIKWGISERRAVYRLMLHILELEARS